jgi:hypothetical protein
MQFGRIDSDSGGPENDSFIRIEKKLEVCMAIPSGSLRAALLGGAIVIAILSYAIAPASADNGAKPSPAEKNIFDFGMDDPPAPPGELAKPLPPELKPPAQPGPPAVPPAAKPDATPAPAPSPPVAKPDKPAIPPRHRPAPPLPAPNPLPPLLRVAARKKVPPAAHAFLQSALKAASVRGDVMTLSEIVRVALISGDAEIARGPCACTGRSSCRCNRLSETWPTPNAAWRFLEKPTIHFSVFSRWALPGVRPRRVTLRVLSTLS